VIAVSGIEARIRLSHPGRLIVLNPQNLAEDLSERWGTNPQLYAEFTKFIRELWDKWTLMFAPRGIPKLTQQLESFFGEDLAKTVIRKQTQDMEAARNRQTLGILKNSGIVTGAATGSTVAIRPHTFYGEDK
jgi:hypothetical protein